MSSTRKFRSCAVVCCSVLTSGIHVAPRVTAECENTRPEWIWCDDFEVDRSQSYFEISTAGESFMRVPGVGLQGSTGMRARFHRAQINAGFLHLAFGRTPGEPFRAVDGGRQDYREIYWRLWVRYDSTWVGGGADKMSRATVFTSRSWSQAMIAHVWSGKPGPRETYLVLDPATGMDRTGRVRTRKYNDFERLQFVGSMRSAEEIFAPARRVRWQCIEAHVRLNDAGHANGVFELWVDGRRQAGRSNVNWVGTFSEYGVNAVFLENYWNAGAPNDQSRYFDNFVVSTHRIGCDVPE